MKVSIEYRKNNEVVGLTNDIDETAAPLAAQLHMNQFREIDEAYILTPTTFRVVSRATEWQKRNG